jgi:hypothetical protein
VCVRTFVRRLSGHALRFRVQTFAANSKLGVGWNTTRLHAKDYISSDPKSEAKSVVVTMEGVQRPSSCSRNTSEERTARASAVGFAATVTEPFLSGKRVRARITARQAPFRKGRGTPCGCASLRGVDRPCPRPYEPSRYVRNVSLCPSGATPSTRQSESCEEVVSIGAD